MSAITSSSDRTQGSCRDCQFRCDIECHFAKYILGICSTLAEIQSFTIAESMEEGLPGFTTRIRSNPYSPWTSPFLERSFSRHSIIRKLHREPIEREGWEPWVHKTSTLNAAVSAQSPDAAQQYTDHANQNTKNL
jgi:hypothetical protein